MNELISVIINVFNGEKYIKKCLDSVINQTYKNLEILIINDGSTDNTLNICESYKDERIKIISQENIGISRSRNVGIDNSNGNYLYFVDVDDFISPDTIEYLYNLIQKYDVPIATCNSIDIYDYNIAIKNEKENTYIISAKEMLKRILFVSDRSGNIWNKLMKKELFNSLRFENRIISDVAVVYKIILTSKQIVYSNQIKYFYLRHLDSIMGQKKTNWLIDMYDATLERYDYIKKIYPQLIENELGVILMIITLYLTHNTTVRNYLKEKGAFQLYKKLFCFKILKCKIGLKNKLKICLFRINPKLFDFFLKIYLKIKSIFSKKQL